MSKDMWVGDKITISGIYCSWEDPNGFESAGMLEVINPDFRGTIKEVSHLPIIKVLPEGKKDKIENRFSVYTGACYPWWDEETGWHL